MNFSGSLIWGFATLFIVFVASNINQADAADSTTEATLNILRKSFEGRNLGVAGEELERRYMDAFELFYKSREIILNAIEKTKQVNMVSGTTSLQNAFNSSLNVIFESAVRGFELHGIVLGLSNNKAKSGLEVSNKLTQIGGLRAFNAIGIAENLINNRIRTGGEISQALLDATCSIIENGFKTAIPIVLASVNEAIQALEDAQDSSNESTKIVKCANSFTDPHFLAAKEEIEKACIEAKKTEANEELLEELKQTFLCSLGDLLNIEVNSKQFVENLSLDGNSSVINYIKQYGSVDNAIHEISAKLLVSIGYVAEKLSIQSNEDIRGAIYEITTGKLNCLLAFKTNGDLLGMGQDKESVLKTQDYAIQIFLQSILNGFRLVSKLL